MCFETTNKKSEAKGGTLASLGVVGGFVRELKLKL